MPTQLPDTLSELQDLCRFFEQAERHLKNGEMVDLSGIDTRVSTLCQTVQNALPEQQKDFLPEMTILIELLNTYELSLRQIKGCAEQTPADTAEPPPLSGQK